MLLTTHCQALPTPLTVKTQHTDHTQPCLFVLLILQLDTPHDMYACETTVMKVTLCLFMMPYKYKFARLG